MTTKYEYYNTGDSYNFNPTASAYGAQTFTSSISHVITSVKLELAAPTNNAFVTTVTIYATDGDGKPTGSSLATGTIASGTIGATDTWYEVSLGVGIPLTANTKYAIVVSTNTSSNYLNWRVDHIGATYASGQFWIGSGGTWTGLNDPEDCDAMFEEWGTAISVSAPTVVTNLTTAILPTTATGNGEITSIGNALVTEHGHCWSTSANPTTADSKTTKGAGSLGTFISSITGLTAGTTYHVRAYATNANGTSYGTDLTFATPAANTPQLTTEVCTSLTPTTATGNGTITSIGASLVSQHGHCWGTSVNPTTSDSKTQNGWGVVGAFTSAITGLTAATTYYVRAYATNTQGTSYGNNIIMIAGVTTAAEGSELAGVIAIVKTRIHYLDAYGRERYIEGIAI